METIGTATVSDHTFPQQPDIRIPFWCAISSMLLVGAWEGLRFHDLRWFDFVWLGFSIFPYLLVALFLTIKRTYLGLVLALQINVITILVVAWALGIATGQGGRIKASNALPFLSLLALVSMQAISLLTSVGAIIKIPKLQRYPPAWIIVPLTLLGLLGLSIIFGWIMSWGIGS